jgi:hypothetical protein
VQGKWQHDMFQSPAAVGGRGGRGGGAGGQRTTKLMISNLDYGVSTDDIKVNAVYHRRAWLKNGGNVSFSIQCELGSE